MKEKYKIILNTKHKEDIKVQMKKNSENEFIIQVIDKEVEDGEGHISFDNELGQFLTTKKINKDMKINNFDMYLDGGTIELETDKGIFCFDDRILSNTKGRLYEGYPKDDNSNLLENSEDLETELVESLKLYKNDFYQSSIGYFIDSKQK